MPVTFEMTNWNDTTFEVSNWTDIYPVLDATIEEFVEQVTYNETIEAASSSSYNFTHRHVAMAWVPHITGLLSLIGSSLIVWDVYRKRFQSVYDRLLFGLAASDIIASLGMALSTWPVPIYQAQTTWGALGNIQSCEFQGFIIQLGLATPLYSAALSIYYVMLVKFNYKADSIQMLRFEKISHIFATSLAVITASISLAMKQYNNANIWCWIAPYPYGCEDAGTCERGNHATLLRMVFYFSWLWLSFLIVTVSMIVLAYTVISQTNKMDRYRQKGQKRSKVQTDRIRSVTLQSALYILAFMVTALPLSVARIYQAKYSCSSTFFPLSITTVTVFPLQGFWNAIIFFRAKLATKISNQQIGKRVSALFWTSGSSSSPSTTVAGSSLFRTASDRSMGLAGKKNKPAPLVSLGGVDYSDSEDEDDDDEIPCMDGPRPSNTRSSWSIAQLQQLSSMNITQDSSMQDHTVTSTIMPDGSDALHGSSSDPLKLVDNFDDEGEVEKEKLRDYEQYLADQQLASEQSEQGDVEMDGSKKLSGR